MEQFLKGAHRLDKRVVEKSSAHELRSTNPFPRVRIDTTARSLKNHTLNLDVDQGVMLRDAQQRSEAFDPSRRL